MATEAGSTADGSIPASSVCSVRDSSVMVDSYAPAVASGSAVLGQHPKSVLQERAQKRHYALPTYARDRRGDMWHATVTVNGHAYAGVHDHSTAKDAEADAATVALRSVNFSKIPATASAARSRASVVVPIKQTISSRRVARRGTARGRARGRAVAATRQRHGRAGAGSPEDTYDYDPYAEGREVYREWYGYDLGNTGYDPD